MRHGARCRRQKLQRCRQLRRQVAPAVGVQQLADHSVAILVGRQLSKVLLRQAGEENTKQEVQGPVRGRVCLRRRERFSLADLAGTDAAARRAWGAMQAGMNGAIGAMQCSSAGEGFG